MAVFYRQDIEKSAPVEKPDALKETTQAKLDALQKELEWAKDIEQKHRIREEILSIKRGFNRSKQYGNIMKTKPAEWKSSLDTISAADLMRIDKESKLRRGEFLSKSFLYKRTTDKEGNISEEPSDGKNLKEWDTLFVDFGKNKSADDKIGAGDFLSMEIKVVKITDLQGNIRIGKRSIQGNKVGYYDEQWYIPVRTGFTIQIPNQKESEDYLKNSNPEVPLSENLESENQAKDTFIEIADRYDKIWGFSPWELEKRQAFQKEATELAKEMEAIYGVPWEVSYAQAVLESNWWRSVLWNNYFGVKWVGNISSTKEFRNGQWVTENASFKSYDSMRESFEDHAKLLKKQWPQAFETKDPIQFTSMLVAQPPKYATDPDYIKKIQDVINGYDKLANARATSLELIGNTSPETFIQLGEKMLGTPYIGWRTDANAVDCSWFVSKLMRDSNVATPWFRVTAAGLTRYTSQIDTNSAQKWDLMFFWWPHMYSKVPTYNHVAIVLEPPYNGMVKILDASGQSNEWKVAIRTVKLEPKHSFWRPQFYS